MRILYTQGGAAAIAEDGRLAEYRTGSTAETADTVYLGRVERIVPGLDAAFVDIGAEKNGFLPLREKSESFTGGKLACGDRVPVQIRREAHGNKGAFLSRDLTLTGTFLILMPFNRYIGVSARLGEEVAARLRALGWELTAGDCGLVFRTAAETASEADIAAEYAELQEQWEALRRASATAHVPSVLRGSGSAAEALLRDYAAAGIDRVVTDDEAIACAALAAGIPAERAEKPFTRADIEAQRDRALSRIVHLKSGGSLVIDPCEALTVIDVNTGAFTGRRGAGDTLRDLNVEACAEIALQLRLRNLGGIIIIDFIDMETEDDRATVLAALEQALQSDRRKTVVHGFTALGLVEMTRKRTGKTLREELTTHE